MNSFVRNLLRASPRGKRLIKDTICVIRREPKITWEALSDKYLIELIGKENPIILDIGSNDGTHTSWFLALFRRARIYSFEPDPRARERYLAKINDKRAVLFDLALSDIDGVRHFYLSSGIPPCEELSFENPPADWDLSGSIRKPKKHLKKYPWCRFEKKIVVATKTLDSWVREQGLDSDEIDLIWADVQGAEVDLIAGGKETLRRTRHFYTEYSNTELYEGQINLRQLFALLSDFHVLRRYEKDVLLKNARFQ
jgi:FkbM family methyltransferase